MLKKEYTYFVSYTHMRGFGCASVSTSEKIKNWNDIQLLKSKLEEINPQCEDIVIISFQLF